MGRFTGFSIQEDGITGTGIGDGIQLLPTGLVGLVGEGGLFQWIEYSILGL